MKIKDISDSKRQQTITVDYKRLFNGFVLVDGVSLQGKTNKSITMKIPEYVEGIPTEKKRVKERFDLIKSCYCLEQTHTIQRKQGRSEHNIKNPTKLHSTSLSFGPSMVGLFFTALYITSRLNNWNVYGLEQIPKSS